MKTPDLSIVLTIYKQREAIALLVQEIKTHMANSNITYEIIMVDDWSNDGTGEAIQLAAKDEPRLKAVLLASNTGQHTAATAGLDVASGKYVIVMDGDFEDPIDQILPLYKKITSGGLDIVYTVAQNRQAWSRKLTSSLFYFAFNKIFRVNLVKNQLMMRIMSRDFVDRVKLYRERVRTLTGITAQLGGHYDVLPVVQQQRRFGKSNYNFFSRMDMFVDYVLGITANPLKILLYVGLIVMLLSVSLAGVYLYRYVTMNVPAGYTSVLLSVWFLGGATLMTIAIIARYLSIILLEVKQRPLYHVAATCNLDQPNATNNEDKN